MITVSAIIAFLEEKFPPSYAEDFDNIGLLLGRSDRSVSKAIVCLDFSKKVCEEAIKKGAELIITHHPVIFSPIKRLDSSSPDSEALLFAIENKISVYSAHTNLDSAPDGLTDFILKKLGLSSIGTMEGELGRVCRTAPNTTAFDLIARIKKEFKINKLYSTLKENKPVNTVSICNGGGGGELADLALINESDIYISGDLKHHEVLKFSLSKTSDYIEIRHHDCEFCVTELLKSVLDSRFKDSLETEISEFNTAPLIDTDSLL